MDGVSQRSPFMERIAPSVFIATDTQKVPIEHYPVTVFIVQITRPQLFITRDEDGATLAWYSTSYAQCKGGSNFQPHSCLANIPASS